MGRLTRAPELRHTASNTAVTTFTLAVDRGGKKSDSAQQTADFIDVVTWEAKAEFAAKWFNKGQLVAVVGRLQTRKWQDKEGNNRTAFEVIADELHFAESRAKEAEPPVQPSYAGAPVSVTPLPSFNGAVPLTPPGVEELSDDTELPF